MVLRWEKMLYKSSEDELVAVLGAPLLVQPQVKKLVAINLLLDIL